MPKKTSSQDVRVEMTDTHTYRTGASTTRTLPRGWKGPVPEKVGTEIKKAGKGTVHCPAPEPTQKPRPPKNEPPEPTPSATNGAGSGDAGRLELFSGIVKGLAPDHYTEAGLPEVDALNAAIGEDVTRFDADERDSLWAAHKDAETA